jgi:hypothetical protein
MTTTAPTDCPELDALQENSACVHLLIRLRGDWAAQRPALVEAMEQRTHAALAYANSAAFRQRFGDRIGVVRVQTDGAVPSVVAAVFSERGVEIEDLSAARPSDGPTCGFCGRTQLSTEQATMTDEGWSCPSCFRAWNVKAQPQLAKPPRRFFIPPQILWPLLALVALLFLVGVAIELRHLSHMNQIIRQHMPTE